MSMAKKESTAQIGNVKYYYNGTYGAWCKSYERGVKVGETRFIGNKLMYAYNIYGYSLFKHEIWWCATDGADSTEVIKRWWDSIR